MAANENKNRGEARHPLAKINFSTFIFAALLPLLSLSSTLPPRPVAMTLTPTAPTMLTMTPPGSRRRGGGDEAEAWRGGSGVVEQLPSLLSSMP